MRKREKSYTMLQEVESMASFDLDRMEKKAGKDWGKQCTTQNNKIKSISKSWVKKYPVQGFCSLRRKDCCCKRCTKLQGHFLNTAASSEGLSAILLVPLEGKMPLAEHLSPNLGITAQNKLRHCVWTRPDGGKPLGSDFQVNEETGAGDFKNIVVSISQHGVWHKQQNLHPMKHWGINTPCCIDSQLPLQMWLPWLRESLLQRELFRQFRCGLG